MKPCNDMMIHLCIWYCKIMESVTCDSSVLCPDAVLSDIILLNLTCHQPEAMSTKTFKRRITQKYIKEY